MLLHRCGARCQTVRTMRNIASSARAARRGRRRIFAFRKSGLEPALDVAAGGRGVGAAAAGGLVAGGCHDLEYAYVAVALGRVRGLRTRDAYGEARERAAERQGRRRRAAWHDDRRAARGVQRVVGIEHLVGGPFRARARALVGAYAGKVELAARRLHAGDRDDERAHEREYHEQEDRRDEAE